MMKKWTLLWIVVGASILFNLLFFVVDIYPVLSEIMSRKIYVSQASYVDDRPEVLEKQILNAALKMAGTTKHIMPYEEQTHFIGEIKKKIKQKPVSLHRWFDHPKGLLFIGLTKYAMSKSDTLLMQKISVSFDRLLIDNKEAIYSDFRVDHIPFGLAAINLYTFLGQERYKQVAEMMFSKLNTLLVNDRDGLIYYRLNQADKLYLVDTLGMVCPFLIRYGDVFNNAYAVQLAYNQMEFYSQCGLDERSFLPAHAVLREGNIKVGSQNWGRGVGWYFYPVAEYSHYVEMGTFENVIAGIVKSMRILKREDGLWTKFPGTSDQFDASPTLMYMYSKNLIAPGTFPRDFVFSALRPYINNGVIGSTSGGAFSINDHSRAVGDSELSMGFLMMLLSVLKD